MRFVVMLTNLLYVAVPVLNDSYAPPHLADRACPARRVELTTRYTRTSEKVTQGANPRKDKDDDDALHHHDPPLQPQ